MTDNPTIPIPTDSGAPAVAVPVTGGPAGGAAPTAAVPTAAPTLPGHQAAMPAPALLPAPAVAAAPPRPAAAPAPAPFPAPAQWVEPPVSKEVRPRTIMWGFVVIALALLAFAAGVGAAVDMTMASIWLLIIVGVTLIVAAIASAARKASKAKTTV